MKKEMIIICAIVLFTAGSASAAITVYPNDRPGWESAVGVCEEESFTDAALNPGVSVVSGYPGYVNTTKGVWWDRLVCPYYGLTTTIWQFDTPIIGYGGNWNPGVPGGPGAHIAVAINGSWVSIGEIPKTYTGQFWGFVSTEPFSAVRLSPGSNCDPPGGAWCETYELDNMVYSIIGCEAPPGAVGIPTGVDFDGCGGITFWLPWPLSPCLEKQQFAGGPQEDCLQNDGAELTDDCENKFQVWCVRDLENCGTCFGFFFIPGGGGPPKEVGRCPFTGGRNGAQVWQLPDENMDDTPDAFVKSEWVSQEPGTDKNCWNSSDPSDPGKNWWVYTFNVRTNTVTSECYSNGDLVVSSTDDLPPVLEEECTGEVPMTAIEPRKPCDLNLDGRCDATDFLLFTNRIGKCVGDTGYTVITDVDLDGCVAVTDQQELYPVIPFYVDIKPQSCPNPLNLNSTGVLPVAILGTSVHDVSSIDPASVMLEGVAPIQSNIEDVAAPVANTAITCECTTDGADGFMDMTLKFDVQSIVATLGPVEDGDTIVLTLSGITHDSIPIEGQDCMLVIDKGPAKPSGETPKVFSLDENYPNPFNAETQISFSLPERTHVSLTIYNILGEKVKTLVKAEVDAGTYTIRWDGTDGAGNPVASGVYFYHLSGGEYTQTRKMVLMK